MNRTLILATAILLAAPAALAHKPPGPVTYCQPYEGEAYHDYLPPNGLWLVVANDGNLEDCGPGNWVVGPVFNNHGNICQSLKADPALADVHALLCLETDTGVSQSLGQFDGEFDHGFGGALLAVETGDGATWGAYVCWGMIGHHTGNIYAQEWPDGTGPAFKVVGDHSRTPPPPGPKGPRPDCGDGLFEPCDGEQPGPSTQIFPLNLVFEVVNGALWQLFKGNRLHCNPLDCMELNRPVSPSTTRSNPFGSTHLVTRCAPGIDGTYWVFIQNDLDEPDFPLMGHVWTY